MAIKMARFNTPSAINSRTENLAGGEAFIESTKLEFVSILLTSFVKNQFYRSTNETLERVTELLNGMNDMKFAAKAAIYARNEFGMRSITHFVAGEIANRVKNVTWSKNFFEKVVRRPDDITEIMAYYLYKYNKPIPNSLKKGLAKAFDKFNEYQLAKYRSEKASVSLIDIVNIVHPIPTEKNGEALRKLVNNKLVSKDTWESELTKAGQQAENEEDKERLKKNVWFDLIKEKKIGYFALLRNLRNILEQAPEIIDDALALLVDENLIKKSLVLPFRFITAIKEIQKLSDGRTTLIALNKAIDISLSNVPKLEGETLIALDVSGSMIGRPAEIASLFAAVLYKSNNADLLVFSDDAEYCSLNPTDSTLTITQNITFSCGGTNFHSIFEKANKAYNRIIILSDMQGWLGYNNPTSSFNNYKLKYNCNPHVYSIDLQGYGSLQFPERNVYCLAGFSEKIFDIFKLLEQDRKALINEIDKIEL